MMDEKTGRAKKIKDAGNKLGTAAAISAHHLAADTERQRLHASSPESSPALCQPDIPFVRAGVSTAMVAAANS